MGFNFSGSRLDVQIDHPVTTPHLIIKSAEVPMVWEETNAALPSPGSTSLHHCCFKIMTLMGVRIHRMVKSSGGPNTQFLRFIQRVSKKVNTIPPVLVMTKSNKLVVQVVGLGGWEIKLLS